MLKIGTKILQFFLLLTTVMALIGVNVSQFYCVHAEEARVEVGFVFGEECCTGECPEKDCHDQTRYDFYKITDFSKIEHGIQLKVVSCYLPETILKVLLLPHYPVEEYFSFRHEIPDRKFSRELLCSYLC